MSLPKPPSPAKLVIGIFTNDKDLIHPVSKRLCGAFGDIDLISPWFPFDLTDYYTPEMGAGLIRRMMAFKTLVSQDHLSTIKTETNRVEHEFALNRNRRVNIDPGYLICERFVLATGKNAAHRICVGNNIYADLTLIYQNGGFQSLPWTYPDYTKKDILEFLRRVRRKYRLDMKAYPGPPKGSKAFQ
jgi:hypothetical protein